MHGHLAGEISHLVKRNLRRLKHRPRQSDTCGCSTVAYGEVPDIVSAFHEGVNILAVHTIRALTNPTVELFDDSYRVRHIPGVINVEPLKRCCRSSHHPHRMYQPFRRLIAIHRTDSLPRTSR